MRLAGLGPCLRIDHPETAPHLVLSIRRKGENTILHLTDLTSHINGTRVRPVKSAIIDDPRPIEEVHISVPMSRPPTAVRVVPEGTSIRHKWDNGVLSLTLGSLFVHAAVMVTGVPDGPTELLSEDTEISRRFAWAHYANPRIMHVSFESEHHGHQFDAFADCTVRESGRLTIRATSETASEGRSSAKFVDGPHEQPFLPYLFLQPYDLSAGEIQFAADFRLTAGAEPSLEFRTVENRREYPVGPSLRFASDGTLRTEQGRKLTTVPHDEWFRVEITCRLDSGSYDLRLAIPGDPVREFRNLPCVSGADFRCCGWIGICSNARKETVFYIDNLRVQPGNTAP
jgi:hypothetical protein